LPVAGSAEQKQTNEIGMFTQLLDAIEIKGKLITADALLTQCKLADYIVVQRGAHYHFTAKGNQPTLEANVALLFQDRKAPDFTEVSPPDHGRIETSIFQFRYEPEMICSG
jgi:predicted transposase YbfD/YdcC